HPAWGTRNALIALGRRIYLEIIGPDPDQPPPGRPRPFHIDYIDAPHLFTWAVGATDLERFALEAKTRGVELGEVRSGSRRTEDGTLLSWKLTDPLAPREGGVVPFFIDWGNTRHPAESAPKGCALVDLRASHPEHRRVQ